MANKNEPAFPTVPDDGHYKGLSKYEYAVIHIAAAMSNTVPYAIDPEDLAITAIVRADVLLKQLEKQNAKNPR